MAKTKLLALYPTQSLVIPFTVPLLNFDFHPAKEWFTTVTYYSCPILIFVSFHHDVTEKLLTWTKSHNSINYLKKKKKKKKKCILQEAYGLSTLTFPNKITKLKCFQTFFASKIILANYVMQYGHVLMNSITDGLFTGHCKWNFINNSINFQINHKCYYKLWLF